MRDDTWHLEFAMSTHAATFSTALIHEDQAKLTSLVAWGNEVAVGTAEGLLLHLAPPPESPAAEPSLRSRVRASAGQCAVVQLCVAEACGLLVLLLADGSIATHEVPSLKSRGAIEGGGDCTQIAMLRASTAEGCWLAAAGRKRLVVYRWRAGTESTAAADAGSAKPLVTAEAGCFEPLSEVALPEPMRWMAWNGEQKLWIALSKRYVTLQLASRQMCEVLPYAASGKSGGSSRGDKNSVATASGPLGESLPGSSEALLLAQDTIGVFVDAGGRPSRGFSLAFAEAPLALAAAGPAFLIALHRKGADVHALHGARPPLQRLPQLAGAIALASARDAPKPPAMRPTPIFVLSAHSVERLLPPTLLAHTFALAAAGELDEALALSERHVIDPLMEAGEQETALAHLDRLAQIGPPTRTSAAASEAQSKPAVAPQPKQHKRSISSGISSGVPAAAPSDEGGAPFGGDGAAGGGGAAAPGVAPAAGGGGAGGGSVSVSRLSGAIVTCLRRLDVSSAEEGAILRRHADALLRREPAAATTLLCPRLPSGGWLLEPAAARGLMSGACPEAITMRVLEAMLDDSNELERPDAVKALIDVLLPAAAAAGDVAAGDAAAGGGGGGGGAAEAARERLLHVLRESHLEAALDTERTLLAIEKATASTNVQSLGRHRLLLLGFLGRHREALDVLTTQLHDVSLAYEYCAEQSSAAPPAQPAAASLFVQLLERYLRPSDGRAPMLDCASELLKRWPEGVSSVEALKRLPAELPIAALEPGLAALLRDAKERLRHSQVRAALLRAVSLQTRAELQAKRSRKLVVDAQTECAVCGRRIGQAAFVWLASGSFAHIGCHGGAGVASTNP